MSGRGESREGGRVAAGPAAGGAPGGGGPVFELDGATFAYPGAGRPALEEVSVRFADAAITAILGPNGSGKSTLLRLLLGALRPDAGRVLYLGRDVGDWRRRDMARRVGVVPQAEEAPFPLTVRELVAMGRYPHLGPLRPEGPGDRDAIARALERCDATDLAERPVSTLSGGERQRVRIARALAQEPSTLVLDEPTAALDIRHEMAIFALLDELAREGVTVVVVTHNLNLAARYADRLILLDRGRLARAGGAAEVLDARLLESVYHWPLAVVAHPGPGPDRDAPQVVALRRR